MTLRKGQPRDAARAAGDLASAQSGHSLAPRLSSAVRAKRASASDPRFSTSRNGAGQPFRIRLEQQATFAPCAGLMLVVLRESQLEGGRGARNRRGAAVSPPPMHTLRGMTSSVSPASDQSGPRERKRNPFTKSAQGGRILSAVMLPFFMVTPPAGFAVLTTTGRRTGKRRRKCVRAVREGNRAYLVMLGPALLGRTGPGTTSAWLWNVRSNPNVDLRIRGRTFAGVARELDDGPEKERAKEVYCEAVHAFDYMECNFHLGGRPTGARIKQLHRHWFDTGIPVAIDLRG